eukprot:scaffold3755_cov74-Phaeocystis_antarctica.AAC.1
MLLKGVKYAVRTDVMFESVRFHEFGHIERIRVLRDQLRVEAAGTAAAQSQLNLLRLQENERPPQRPAPSARPAAPQRPMVPPPAPRGDDPGQRQLDQLRWALDAMQREVSGRSNASAVRSIPQGKSCFRLQELPGSRGSRELCGQQARTFLGHALQNLVI